MKDTRPGLSAGALLFDHRVTSAATGNTDMLIKLSSPTSQGRETISVLADWFPQCFVLYQQRRKPLKIGIFDDLLAATSGAIAPKELQAALRRYCRSAGYLAACREGTARIDLNGNVVGAVTKSEAEYAARIIARRRSTAKPTAKPVITAPSTTPRKLSSLADLRAAARARKAATP
jgi:sRNA-binding protein